MSGIVLAEGVVEITADAKGVPAAISKDLTSGDNVTREAGASVGRSIFGGLIGAWAAIGGARIIGDFFKGSITGASDFNETMSKSKAIFGENAGAMTDWSSNAAHTVGLSQSAALAAAASFGDMFLQLGFVGDQAATMSQSVVQAAADLGSFSNLETADVADRISAAFRGEYDSLQAVIPNINAARVESEALAATGKTVASELTAQEKATAVLAIVQADGARAMGDFARTSGGAANQQKIATAAMEDQQQKLGGLLLPAWTSFLGFLNNSAIPAFASLIDWMGQNKTTIGLLAGVVGVAAVAYWGITTAMAVHKAFQIASAASTGTLTIAQWALNAAMSANPIGLIIIAIAALVAGIIWVATQTTFFQDVWTNVMTAVGGAFSWVWNSVISPVFGWISDALTNVGNAVRDIFGGIGSFIGDVFNNIVGFIKGPINTVISFLNQAIDGANIVGGAFGVNIAHIPMLADGGRITGSGSVIVGERGPEILNLGRGASVVPLDSSAGMGALVGGDLIINEAEDPLGSAGRVAAELRKWRKK